MNFKFLQTLAIGVAVLSACTALPAQPPSTVTDAQVISIYNKALNGDARSMRIIGEYYNDGSHGFPKDKTQAINCFEIAANHGDISAIQYAGLAYYYGLGRKQSIPLARKYFTKGVSMGDEFSKNRLKEIEKKYGNGATEGLFVGGTNEGRELLNDIWNTPVNF